MPQFIHPPPRFVFYRGDSPSPAQRGAEMEADHNDLKTLFPMLARLPPLTITILVAPRNATVQLAALYLPPPSSR
ncbi:unnamed protein product [Protopolystoma xenopodis]|uniref:Uncharacterized protein n=1 Tax=Protopolystoma xenopodis TaxID=117903 RepID=A0A448WYV5_9PLAT|nr:unnamed protein product [Protopolystoma xenopodis]